MPNLTDVFLEFQEHINSDQDIREAIKNIVKIIEQTSREIITCLQVIHTDEARVSEACGKARDLFNDVRSGYLKLADAFPSEDYYRYRDHWKFVTQRLCFSAALIVWLEVGILISRETAAAILGINPKPGTGEFHLDIEDFLMGLLELSSELARLAVNSVTRGDYSKPLQISQFVMELNSGFRLLNLKNDNLRKRFDALKYDVKKIEEVVYDLSIRGLTHATRQSAAAPSLPLNPEGMEGV